MKEITKKWIEISDKDLNIAQDIFKLRYWGHTVMMSHQSIEKAIKANLAEQDKHIPRIHDLAKLTKLTGIDFSDNQLQFIEEINPHYQLNRYLDISYNDKFRYNKESAGRFLSNAKELQRWLKSKLNTKE